MNTQNRKELLDKYIKEFKQYTENSGDLHDTDFESSKKVYRKLETKDDVMKILSQEYLKEYKELEKECVDEVHRLKTDVMNLRKKKRRFDTKTKELEKDLKPMLRELKKLQTKVRNKMKVIDGRKDKSNELNKVIVDKRKQYQVRETEHKIDIQGNKEYQDDEYYLKYFKMMVELQYLYDGKKIYIDKINTHPRFRMRFFGGSGRNGFDITGRIGKDVYQNLKTKLKRNPRKNDLLPIVIPQIKFLLDKWFQSNKYEKYLRLKTRPIDNKK